MLAKGFDPPQLLLRRRQLPVGPQFVPVLDSPLDREAERTRGKMSGEHVQTGDRHRRLELPVVSMKVGWQMVVEVHPDDDPEESRDFGHRATVRTGAYRGLTPDRSPPSILG